MTETSAPPSATPEPGAPERRAALLGLGVAVAWLAAHLPFQLWGAASGLRSDVIAAEAALRLPAASLVEVAAGVTPAMLEVLRRQPVGAPVVVFCGEVGPEAESWVRLMFERVKNLVYPHPREFAYAVGAAALQPFVVAGNEGRLLVMDYTQASAELPVVAEFEPAGTGLHMRFWRLKKAGS